MLNLQTAASSENNGVSSHSSKSHKKDDKSGGGDFLATLLNTIKKEEKPSTNTQNSYSSQSSQNSTQEAQTAPQNSYNEVASNEERLNIDENKVVSEEQKSATLESVSSSDEDAENIALSDGETALDEEIATNKIIEWVDGKPVLKESPITQILSVLELANGGEIDKLPALSKGLEKLINIESNLSELKNVKDLKELLKIAEKLELNLAKITISGSELKVVKTTFPKLAQIEFFKPVEVALNKAVAQNKAPSLPTANISLASLLKGDLPKPTTITSAIASAAIASKSETSVIKAPQNSLQSILNHDIIKNQTKDDLKNLAQELKNEAKIDPKATPTPKAALNEVPKENLKELLKTANSKKDEAKVDPKQEIKADLKSEIRTELKTDIKVAQPILNKEINQDPNKAFDVQNYLNMISKKAASAIEETSIQNINLQDSKDPSSSESQIQELGSDIKNNLSQENMKDMINAIKMQDRIISKDIQINSVRTFAAEMVERISEFKPPVTRINMQLHPAELGEVNVTMIARANNLHVNITSTNNTMALFLQNQAEFKANLVNMGFSGIEMSFNDSKEGSQNANQQNGKRARAAYEEDENNLNEIEGTNGESTLEIVLPRYI